MTQAAQDSYPKPSWLRPAIRNLKKAAVGCLHTSVQTSAGRVSRPRTENRHAVSERAFDRVGRLLGHAARSAFALLAVILAALLFPSAAGAQDRPNFVVIFADDLGYGDLGVYGSERIRTPHLDRMAAEGMRFTDFYAAAPFCSPSRASILTGRYPIRAGVPYVLFPTESTGLPQAEITLAELLSEAGYATAAIGKWHLGWPKPFRAHRHGFDFFYGLPYSNDMLKWEPVEIRRAQHAFWKLPLMEDDTVVEAPVNQHTLTKRYTERAVSFIRENRNRPFFLYFPHTFPHNPQYASEDFEGRSLHGLYSDTVEELDWSVGELLDTLDELGLDERTLVVFTSDNGPSSGGTRWGKRSQGGTTGGLRGRKGNTYEGGMRVPAIFRWPGRIGAGTLARAPTSILDLMPTFAELAGEEMPDDRVIDGRSIADLLLGRAELTEAPFFYYFGVQLQAVRVGRWKLHIRRTELPPHSASLWYLQNDDLFTRHHRLQPEPELYDLEADPSETQNAAVDHPDVVERLDNLARQFDEDLQRDKRPQIFLDSP